ncbi:MAG: flagellar biosynthesis protein FlhA, partial [Candidatus Eremiobacteraeota bacterium]|nr:flagellar biosynthesis protein FlhA [Candidatus Eremiobacteraeota bacterium]
AAALLVLLALVPGLPRPVFLILGGCAFGLAHFATRNKRLQNAEFVRAQQAARRQAVRRPEMALGLVGIDAISIDIGSNLTPLLAPPHADALLDRVGEVRRALAAEIGVVVPGVRLRDDLARDENTYAIRVRDELAGEGRLHLERVMAVADETVLARVAGDLTNEPVYGLPAKWIEPSARETAVDAGALVFDPISIVGSHLAEVVRGNAAALVGRQELQTLLEHLRSSVPTLIKEVGTDALPLATVQRVFGLLLRERVWPRDPVAVLEALVEASARLRDPRDLAEAVRREVLPAQLRRRGSEALEPLLLDPGLERDLVASWSGAGALGDAADARRILGRVEQYIKETPPGRAALICTASLRPLLADFLWRSGLRIEVLSYAELPPDLSMRPAGVLPQNAGSTDARANRKGGLQPQGV